MSKKQINIKNNVMAQIKGGKITMHSKAYFVIGSIFLFVGLIALFILSVFLINIMFFILKAHGPMGQYRLELLISNFPWWAPLFSILGIILGIWILRKYDFSYKKNFLLLVILFIGAIVFTGWLMDATGIDNIWFKRGPMQGIMKRYIQGNNIPSPGLNKQMRNNRMMQFNQ